MVKPLMSGIKLYLDAVLKKQYTGRTFIIRTVDLIDLSDGEFNRDITIFVSGAYHGNRGNALLIKGSNTNFMAQCPRLFNAAMNGNVIGVIGHEKSS
jgi:hypothetical protein